MRLTSMQSRDEEDIIRPLQLVLVLAFQLPIGIVDQDQNPISAAKRPLIRNGTEEGKGKVLHSAVHNEKILSFVLH